MDSLFFIVLAFVLFICVFIFFKKKGKIVINYSYLSEQTIQVYKNIILKNKKLTIIRVISIAVLIFGILSIIIFLLFNVFNEINSYVPLLIICGLLLILVIINLIYGNSYKNDIVKKAIESYDPNLRYFPHKGISREKYRFANFEIFDRYYSEDLIEGTILNQPFVMSDVRTSNVSHDENRRETTIFEGSVAYVNLNKNINCFIYIIDNKLKIFNNDYHMTIDNETFEKKYDVYSDNQVLAMRILTPSVTNSIIDLEKKTGIYTEIKIYHDIVYFRFYTDNMFQPIIFNVGLEAKNLALSIQLLMGIKDIISNILTAMMEVTN